jgi:hypothetical protein
MFFSLYVPFLFGVIPYSIVILKQGYLRMGPSFHPVSSLSTKNIWRMMMSKRNHRQTDGLICMQFLGQQSGNKKGCRSILATWQSTG